MIGVLLRFRAHQLEPAYHEFVCPGPMRWVCDFEKFFQTFSLRQVKQETPARGSRAPLPSGRANW